MTYNVRKLHIRLQKPTPVPLTPVQIKRLRKRAERTQSEAARDVHVSLRTWQSWESPVDSPNRRQMPEAHLELFCIKHGIQYTAKIKK